MNFTKYPFVNFLIQISIMFIFLLAIVYAWMFVFLDFMGYDYIVVSNVIFFVGIAYYIFNSLFIYSLMNRDARPRLPSMLVNLFLMAVLVYPLIFLAVFNVYELWSQPALSAQMNPIGIYRSALGVPVHVLQTWILGAGAYLGGLNSLGSYVNRFLDFMVKASNYPLIGNALQATVGFMVFRILSALFGPKSKKESSKEHQEQGDLVAA